MSSPQDNSIRRKMMSFYGPMAPSADWAASETSGTGAGAPSSTASRRLHNISNVEAEAGPTLSNAIHTDPENDWDFGGGLAVKNTTTRNNQPSPSTTTPAAENVPCVKVQRKGTPQVVLIPISLIQTFENLLTCLERIFHHPSFLTPEITTFDGYILSTAEGYSKALKSGLHLIISYPIAQDFRRFIAPRVLDNLGSAPLASASHYGSNSAGDLTVNPAELMLPPGAQSYSDPGPSVARRRKPHASHNKRHRQPRPLDFHPPELSFFPVQEMTVNATLGNKYFPAIVDLFDSIEGYKKGIFSPGRHRSHSPEQTPHQYAPSAPSSPLPHRNWPPTDRSGQWANQHRPRVAGTFPITTWDIFAQTMGRKKVVCGVNYDVVVSPEGTVSCSEGMNTIVKDCISWDLDDVGIVEEEESGESSESDYDMDDDAAEESDQSGPSTSKRSKPKKPSKIIRRRDTSQGGGKINWVNYESGDESEDEEDEEEEALRLFLAEEEITPTSKEGTTNNTTEDPLTHDYYTDFLSPNPERRRRGGKFWMLHPPQKLPPAFFLSKHHQTPAPTDPNMFHLPTATSLLAFISILLRKLPIPSSKETEIISYFTTALLAHNSPNHNHSFTLKLLTPTEAQGIFPTTISPIPELFLRLFFVIWIVPSNSSHTTAIPTELSISNLASTIVSSSTCLHSNHCEGFKALEWGGIILNKPGTATSTSGASPTASISMSTYSTPGSTASSGSQNTIRGNQSQTLQNSPLEAEEEEAQDTEEEEDEDEDEAMTDAYVVGEGGMSVYHHEDEA